MQTNNSLNRLVEKYNHRKALKKCLSLLCAVTILATMLSLKFEALTLEHIPTCGMVEHTHSAECYSDGVATCGMEEHIHTDACYQEKPTAENAAFVQGVDEDGEGAPVEAAGDSIVSEIEAPVAEVGAVDLADIDVISEDIVSEDVEAAAEEVGMVELEGDEGSPIQEDVGNVEEEDAPEPFYFCLTEPILISSITEEIGVNLDQIIEVDPVVNEDEEVPVIGVEVLDGDWLVYSTQDFALAELAVVTANDILILNMFDGVAIEDDGEGSVSTPAVAEETGEFELDQQTVIASPEDGKNVENVKSAEDVKVPEVEQVDNDGREAVEEIEATVGDDQDGAAIAVDKEQDEQAAVEQAGEDGVAIAVEEKQDQQTAVEVVDDKQDAEGTVVDEKQDEQGSQIIAVDEKQAEQDAQVIAVDDQQDEQADVEHTGDDQDGEIIVADDQGDKTVAADDQDGVAVAVDDQQGEELTVDEHTTEDQDTEEEKPVEEAGSEQDSEAEEGEESEQRELVEDGTDDGEEAADGIRAADEAEGDEKANTEDDEEAVAGAEDGEEAEDGEKADTDKAEGDEKTDAEDGEKAKDGDEAEKADAEDGEDSEKAEDSADEAEDGEKAEDGEDGADEPEDGEKAEDGEGGADGEQTEDNADTEDAGDTEDGEETDDGEETTPVVDAHTDMTADPIHIEYDLADVETYPLSLHALIGGAIYAAAATAAEETAVVEEAAVEEPVAEEIVTEEAVAEDSTADETVADEAPVEEAVTEEVPIIVGDIVSKSVEAAAEEVVVELEESIPATLLPITFDEALLSIETTENDYLISVIAGFEQTVVTVGENTITLLNGTIEDETLYPAQAFTASTDYVDVTVTADEGAFPEGTTMVVSDVDDQDTLNGIADSVTEGFVEVQRVHAVDITFLDAEGAEIEPLIPISVVMTVKEIEQDEETVVVHVTNEGEAEVLETEEPSLSADDAVEESAVDKPAVDQTVAEDGTASTEESEEAADASTVAFTADAFSVYAVVVTKKLETKVLASDGETYKIELTYGPDAGIPDGAVLAVSEVTEDESYRAQVEAGLAGNKMITLARFFDITILESDAEDAAEIHPAEAVEVKVTLYDEAVEDKGEEAEYIPEAEVSTVEVELTDEVASEANEDGTEAFKVEYDDSDEQTEEIDHIVTVGDPVACAAHFADESDVAIQTATESDAAITFMAEGFSVWGVVYTVDFYYGNYEWHMEGEGSVKLSALFELLGIEEDAAQAESVVFTNEDLVKVEKEERDWLLTSLMPFNTEEKLTVTMEDDRVYEIRVEDAAYRVYCIPNDSNYGSCAASNGYSTLSADEYYGYSLHVSVTATSRDTNQYRFAMWLRDDGETPIIRDTRPDILDASNVVDRETTFICYFSRNCSVHPE